MMSHLKLLATRRQHLLARGEHQRSTLLIQKKRLQSSFKTLDTGLRLINRVRNSPGLVLGLIGGVVLLAPRRLASLLETGLVLSRGWRLLSPLLNRLLVAQVARPSRTPRSR